MWSHGQLGMAYYDLDTQHIYLMPDTKEDVDFQLMKQGKWSDVFHFYVEGDEFKRTSSFCNVIANTFL